MLNLWNSQVNFLTALLRRMRYDKVLSVFYGKQKIVIWMCYFKKQRVFHFRGGFDHHHLKMIYKYHHMLLFSIEYFIFESVETTTTLTTNTSTLTTTSTTATTTPTQGKWKVENDESLLPMISCKYSNSACCNYQY